MDAKKQNKKNKSTTTAQNYASHVSVEGLPKIMLIPIWELAVNGQIRVIFISNRLNISLKINESIC